MHASVSWRERIDAELSVDLPLTVLHAPSGSGKTSALAQWAARQRESGVHVLWVTLTPDITSPHDLWSATSEAAATVPGVSASAMDLIRNSETAENRYVSTRLLARELPGLTVVVDGCEYVTRDVERMWRTMAELTCLRTGTRFVVSTRWVPPEAETLLRLDPGVHWIGPDVLAARPTEVAEVLAAAGVEVTPALVDDVVAHAGTNLRLLDAAALSMSRAGSTAPDWAALQSAEVDRTIATRELVTAVETLAWLPWFDHDLATLVWAAPQPTIDHALILLENLGLADRQPAADGRPVLRWSQYARSSTLWRSRHCTPGVSDHVARDVVARYEAADFPGTALVAATRTHRLDDADRLLGPLMLTSPDLIPDCFDATLRHLPVHQLTGYRSLATARGLTLLADPATRGVASDLLEALTEVQREETRGETPDQQLVDLALRTIVLHALERPEQAGTEATRVAALMTSPEFAPQCSPRLMASLSCHVSLALYEAGLHQEALRLVAFGLAVAPPDLVHLCATYGRALNALHGRIPEAEAMDAHMRTARADHPRPTPHPRSPHARMALLGEALLLMDRLEFGQVRLLLSNSNLVSAQDWDTPAVLLRWLTVCLDLAEHSPVALAPALIPELKDHPVPARTSSVLLATVMTLALYGAGQVARARALLARTPKSAHSTASLFVDRLLSQGPGAANQLLPTLTAAPGHTYRSRSVLATLGTAAALRGKDETQARAGLQEIADLYALHGIRVQLLMMDATDVDAILALGASVNDPHVTALLAGTEPHVPERPVASLTPVLLTDREEAVLGALVTEPSRKLIATRLHVSENTVKTQLRSLYRKLDAEDRTTALMRAVTLGLLDPA